MISRASSAARAGMGSRSAGTGSTGLESSPVTAVPSADPHVAALAINLPGAAYLVALKDIAAAHHGTVRDIITVVAFNLVGEALRDALDPRLRDAPGAAGNNLTG